MAQKITVLEAAKRMNKSPQFVRIGLQRGILPFGYAIKIGKERYSYHISPKLFYEYVDKEEENQNEQTNE